MLLLILPCYLLEVNGRATRGINGNYQNYIDNSPSIAMKNNSKILFTLVYFLRVKFISKFCYLKLKAELTLFEIRSFNFEYVICSCI